MPSTVSLGFFESCGPQTIPTPSGFSLDAIVRIDTGG